jgi:hypothetical protein
MVEDVEKNYSINNLPIKNRELKGIKWKDAKTKHFVNIIKILAEKGSCTIREIVENDGFRIIAGKIGARSTIYSRIIKGDEKLNIPGLIPKGLVVEDSQVMKSKPTNRYKLSVLGMCYAIRIFTPELPFIGENTEYESRIKITQGKKPEESFLYKDSILEILAKNYSDDLPLIFGKWDFLKKNLKGLVNFLWEISAMTKGGLNAMFRFRDELFNSRPFTMNDGLGYGNLPAVEVTLLFYGKLFNDIGPKKFQQILKQDKDIFDWYSAFISKLLKYKNTEIWGIRLADHALKGEFQKVDELWKKLNTFQGLEPDKSGEKLVRIKKNNPKIKDKKTKTPKKQS